MEIDAAIRDERAVNLISTQVKALQDDMEERWEELADPGGKREALGMCAFGEQGPRGHGNLMVGALLFSNKPVRPTRVEPS